MLKKEFKKKDVNRARNLIMGKTNASTGTQIGYSKKQIEYKECDNIYLLIRQIFEFIFIYIFFVFNCSRSMVS